MRRNDVASTSFRRHVPTRFLINQCQIITFRILKSDNIENIDNIENSRIELREIVLPVPSNQIQVIFTYPSTWYICEFFLFHIGIEGKYGWIIRGDGQRVCWPPSQIIGGPGPLPPLSYAYAYHSRLDLVG